jgi:N-acetyl-gamma-glutamyl-phosphate reductase
MKVKVGIIGITGYAGSELARLLAPHPEAQLVAATSRTAAGKRLPQLMPYLWSLDVPITAGIEVSVDVVFSAVPSGASAEGLAPLVRSGVRGVDIAADFRLKDPAQFEAAYKAKHPAPDLLAQAVFGLTELHRAELARTRLVANPGCYPAGALLALAPAVRHGLVTPDIIVDSKSGISGAGRGGLTTSLQDHFCEADENLLAYGLGGHGHLPEMAQELTWLAGGQKPRLTFVPHRVPMVRGILTTCYAELMDTSLTTEKVRGVYAEFYKGEPFVRLTEEPPQTKHTAGTNLCLLYPVVDPRTQRLIVVSAIDNLGKGASGSAIQNMNVMFGLPETMGLEALALYP